MRFGSRQSSQPLREKFRSNEKPEKRVDCKKEKKKREQLKQLRSKRLRRSRKKF